MSRGLLSLAETVVLFLNGTWIMDRQWHGVVEETISIRVYVESVRWLGALSSPVLSCPRWVRQGRLPPTAVRHVMSHGFGFVLEVNNKSNPMLDHAHLT